MVINVLVLLCRQPFFVEADLTDAAGQMREVFRTAKFRDDMSDIRVADKERLVVPLTNLAVLRNAGDMGERLAVAVRIAALFLVKGHRVLGPIADFRFAALP